MERRRLIPAEQIVALEERQDGDPTISGLAAVFYDGSRATEFELWEGAVERIQPGAFDRAMEESDDVRALFNHDSNQVLGRSKSGTLKLAVDKRGLRYEIDAPDTQLGSDVRELIRRGDVTGSSFAFRVTEQDWETKDDLDIRNIRGVELFDVGPVTFPAYEATTTQARSANEIRDARSSWEAFAAVRHVLPEAERRRKRIRARLVELDSRGWSP